jgi:hypothetical protein
MENMHKKLRTERIKINIKKTKTLKLKNIESFCKEGTGRQEKRSASPL